MHEEKAMTQSPPYDLPMVVETDQEIAEEEVYVFPVSFAQQRLWFLDQFEPGSPFYNVPTAVRLSGRLDVVALERTLNEIVRRHESLRTTFTALDGEPMQVISPSLTLPLPIVDLRHLPEAEREAEAMRLAQEEAKRPFDLSRGPLLRTTLLWLDEEEYLFLLTMHHIICDGWSIGVFIGELTALYTAFSAGKPSPLPELPIQYADFAVWQREWLQGEVLEEQLAYWKQQLGDDPGILELPTDRPRPPIYTNNGAVLSRKLSKELADALQALSREEGVTLFMTLLAAFQTLLHRYTGQEKISVGTPIANRNRAEIEGIIGFFVNTLVLRTDLSGNPTFRHLLKRVREVTLGAYAHQDLPFEMLVDALQPERDMSHTPLFQVMFILQNAPVQGQELPGLTLSQVETHPGTSTFDLTLSMAEGPDGLEASVEYNTDLFDAATIRRMLDHFQTLLEAIAADPDRPIAELPLLTEAERQQLLVEWNDTATDHPQDLCVHQLIEAQAERTPDAVAVVLPSTEGGPDARLTYGELNRRANQLAHHLRKRGVGPETVVGICVERSLEMIVGVLGVLKAGGAYLPLDPLYPPERLAYMLDDAGVAILLTDSNTLPRLPLRMEAPRDEATEATRDEAPGAEASLATRPSDLITQPSALRPQPSDLVTLNLDDWTPFADEPDTNPEVPVSPTNLAYLIYTSGSTGQSKGVMIEHRSLVNAYRGWEASYRLRSVRTHLQMANFAFDVFSGDLVRALCSGGRLVLCPREWLLDPERLYGLMRREGVECAEFVPAVLRHLIQYLDETGERLDFMRLLICGSDSWYVSEYRQFLRFCGPETRLINSFGLTEATIDSCFFEGSAMDLSGEQVVPIGRPFANVRLYILDDHLQPVPVGVPGELFIGGLGVARGYHNRPELTEEKFIPDPFSDDPNARLYRTGDLARYLPDGNIEFLGRLDYQVKVRGYRIELGEIEATLGRHPAVREAAVVALEVAPGDKRLAAYIVPAGETVPTAGELRRFLQERLPDYMVPSAYVVMEALPLTPNGKVDRQALPEPEWSRRQLAGEYVAPRTPVEEVLAGIWSQVLGVEEVGVHDNFFELGGHSLLATQLVSRVREAFEIELPLRHVFECPTVATLAERIEIIRRTEAGVQAPPIRPVPRDREIPLSFAQQRLWFLDQLAPNSPLYNIPDAVRITGPLDVGVLERSLNEIVRRHEVLRTTFAAVEGRPIQVIAPELHLPLPIVDLRSLPKARREAEALRLATEEAQRPFDLARGPLIRALLLRLDEEEHIALLTVHHTVSDGWSTGVFMGEMAALYEAFAAGKPSPLPELPIQYADFAVWQREWLQGEVLERQLAYWKEQLAGLPPILELPTDRPRPAFQTFRGDYQTFTLPEELTQAIKDLCQREGVTLFMTLLAAFQTLLSRYSGQDDISVGVPIANRTRAEIEGLIGFFVNTLVMRTKLDGNPTFREVLKRVREVALGAYAHQDLPFEMLVDALQPERDMSHSPLFQVAFALQSTPARAVALPRSGLTLEPVEAHSGTAKYDLTLYMDEEGDRLSGSLEYNTDLFDADTIRRMLGHFQTLLEAVVADPDRPIAQLPLLTESEQQQMLVRWNATATDFDHDRCAHHLVEAWAARQPHAIAVTFEDQALSYAELDRRANQLAHHLQKLGVGPESLVGISTRRSPEMVIAILAVLKAGGAYLPLDPTYPPERLAFMLQDAAVSVLLVDSRGAEVAEALGNEAMRGEAPGAEADKAPRTEATEALRAEATEALRNEAPGAEASLRPQTSDLGPQTAAKTPSAKTLSATPLAAKPLTAIRLDDWSTFAGEPTTPPETSVSPDNLAYVIYTSGSTGKPKGTMLHHRGLCNLTDAQRRAFGIRPGSRILQFSPLSFDASVWETFMALANGATLCLARRETLASAPDLAALLADQAITNATLPPSMLRVLPHQGLHTLETLISAGEACTPELVERWSPGRDFFNAYGPTETTVCASMHLCADREPDGPPIGRPIANATLYILDPNLQPLPVGVPGELFIGGIGVGRGYLNRPDLTAERFIPDPFSDRPGARLYRTGDLVRFRPDGEIEFLGRIDHQVKVRGFRIELGEIEAVLEEHPALREVAVIVREDSPGDRRLVAYVVPEGETAPGVTELRHFLKEKLPDYMVPSAFVVLEALPLTPSGKVDRKALPAPEQARPDLESDFVAPRTDKEQVLAEIWAQVLGLDRVGVHDNFFELGGDSILSIQVVARANQAGLQLTPRQIFEHPTIAELAAVAGTGRVIQAEQGIVEGPVPLTPIQHWFFEQELPEPHHWNQDLLLEVRQPLDPILLEQAVGHLLAHHDALRLRFRRWGEMRERGNGATREGAAAWEQVNAGLDDQTPFTWVDLSALPTAEQGETIEALTARLQASLDLTHGPLLRVAYFDLGPDRPARLFIVIHHLAVDGVSWRILLEDLQTLYRQLSRGEPAQLPPKTTSFQHWARRLVEYAQSDEVRQELAYWLEVPSDGAARLPVDYPDGDNTEASARSVTVALSPEETQALLQEVPAAYRTEINDALLAALAQAVAKWTGSSALLVALEGHGREDLFDDVDLSRTVGWFTTLYPVRLDLTGIYDPGEALKAVKEQLRRVPRRGIGYGLLRYLCEDEEVRQQIRALPQPEISFNYLGQLDQAVPEGSPFGPAPESGGPAHSPRGKRSHRLEINGVIAGGRLQLEWTYSETLHRRSTIERLAQDFLEALRAIIAHCQSPDAVGYTPSDFAEFEWDQEDLDDIMAAISEAMG